jgi:hypothetical protein
VRAISGAGTTQVDANASLTANSIVQDTLIIGAGGSVTIREVPTAALAAQSGGAGSAMGAVPEPGTWALLIAGAACLLPLLRRWRRTA